MRDRLTLNDSMSNDVVHLRELLSPCAGVRVLLSPHDVRVRVVIAPAGCTWYAQGWRTVFVHGRRVRERGGDGYSDSESG